MISPTEVAWAAGFFEGEGAVMLLANPQSRALARLSVEVSQVDREPLEWLCARWPGPLYTNKMRGNQRQHFRWILTANQAAVFLGDIQPYVIRPVVAARISLALEFQAQKTSTWENRTMEYKQRQEDFVDRMAYLNRRGSTLVERAVLQGRIR